MKENKSNSPLYAHLFRLARPFPNFDVFFVKSLRQKAVGLLQLKEGDRVLDMGCGYGGSFSYLVNAVGESGQVVGVDISPELCISARNRIARNKWSNVDVIQGAAQDVSLPGQFAGLLMFATPDVYASEEALENIFPHLTEDARAVAFGARRVLHGRGKILSSLVRLAISRLSFSTTPLPDEAPWRLLEKRVERLEVEELLGGSMFLASGSVPRKKSLETT